jgi:hypothetical protein
MESAKGAVPRLHTDQEPGGTDATDPHGCERSGPQGRLLDGRSRHSEYALMAGFAKTSLAPGTEILGEGYQAKD